MEYRWLTKMLAVVLVLVPVAWSTMAAAAPPARVEPRRGGVLKAGLTAQPTRLDPHAAPTYFDHIVSYSMFETLVTLDSNDTPRPGLADRWEYSTDRRSVTFHLRKGVKFHNGKAMKAEDVVASLERMQKRLTYVAAGLKKVSRFEAGNDNTVILHLTQPFAAIDVLLANPRAAILPSDLARKYRDEGIIPNSDLVGTGPFKFGEMVPQRYVRLVRFDGYVSRPEPGDYTSGGKTAWVDEIRYITVTEPGAMLAALETGEIDWAERVDQDVYPRLKDHPEVQISLLKFWRQPYLSINLTKPPFNHIKARQALRVGLDRKSIILAQVAYPEFATLSGSLMPPGSRWHSGAGTEDYGKPDVDKAKQLLKEAGYMGEPVTLLTTKDVIRIYRAALVVNDQLKRLGVNVKLEIYDWPTLSKIWRGRAQEGYNLVSTAYFPTVDPVEWSYFRSTSGMPDAFNFPELDRLIDLLETEPDFPKRFRHWEAFQRALLEHVPWLFYGFEHSPRAFRKGVHGVLPKDIPTLYNVWKEK